MWVAQLPEASFNCYFPLRDFFVYSDKNFLNPELGGVSLVINLIFCLTKYGQKVWFYISSGYNVFEFYILKHCGQ